MIDRLIGGQVVRMSCLATTAFCYTHILTGLAAPIIHLHSCGLRCNSGCPLFSFACCPPPSPLIARCAFGFGAPCIHAPQSLQGPSPTGTAVGCAATLVARCFLLPAAHSPHLWLPAVLLVLVPHASMPHSPCSAHHPPAQLWAALQLWLSAVFFCLLPTPLTSGCPMHQWAI